MLSKSAHAKPSPKNLSGLFNYISPTRLNTWLSCPLKFKIRYLDGIKWPTSPNLFLGKRVHDGLEFFYRRRKDGQRVAAAEVSNHIVKTWDDAADDEEMQFASRDDENALKQQAVRLVQTYLDRRDSDEGFPIAVETRLECPLIDPGTNNNLGIPLLGFVDLILEDDSGPVIIDFKTSARSSAPLDVAHEIQLSCYAYAFRHVFGKVEKELQIRSLIKTTTPKVEFHRDPARDDTHFRRLFAVIRAYLDDLHSERFVYRPGWTCSMCDFRETHCRAWQG